MFATFNARWLALILVLPLWLATTAKAQVSMDPTDGITVQATDDGGAVAEDLATAPDSFGAMDEHEHPHHHCQQRCEREYQYCVDSCGHHGHHSHHCWQRCRDRYSYCVHACHH